MPKGATAKEDGEHTATAGVVAREGGIYATTDGATAEGGGKVVTAGATAGEGGTFALAHLSKAVTASHSALSVV